MIDIQWEESMETHHPPGFMSASVKSMSITCEPSDFTLLDAARA